MTDERYHHLNDVEGARLTEEEARAGWHWCREWDFLLVGPEMPELQSCSCPEGKWAKQGGS